MNCKRRLVGGTFLVRIQIYHKLDLIYKLAVASGKLTDRSLLAKERLSILGLELCCVLI